MPMTPPCARAGLVGRAIRALGPGFITGAADSDPASIGTCAKIGATVGFAPLWATLLTYPLMAAVQFSTAKVAIVSGMGLAGVLRRHYPPALLYPALLGLLVANTFNAGADIGAIAAAINLLFPIPTPALIAPIALGILALQLAGSYRLIVNTFRWLTLALAAYVGASFFAQADPEAVLRGTFIPTLSFDSTSLAVLVAILGTTISPYLLFWQAGQEVEEEVQLGRATLWQRQGASDAEVRYAAWDTSLGMLLPNVVMYLVIVASGATLFKAGKADIQSATDAAEALRPLAGDAAGLLLALGLIGSGLLAVPVLTGSSAYAVSEAFGWRSSLDEPLGRARQFYALIVASTLVGMLINFLGINLIDALFWTSVINGFLAPPLLVLLLLVANNRAVMGERVNGPLINALGGVAAAAMLAAALGLVLTWGAGG